MKIFAVITVLLAVLLVMGCVTPKGDGGLPAINNSTTTPPVRVGNDSDSHGCKPSAGYSWCEVKQKCLRVWEENCTRPSEPIACTMEAKLCPDGSAVGRGGPDCEFAACPPDNPSANDSLHGRITIGPLCPVEPCNRTYDYNQVSVNVYSAESKERVAQVNADTAGFYGIALAPGEYQVNVTDASGNSFGMRTLDYTQTVSLAAGHRIELDFDIDTGIR